ncbi:helix-turn-helix domain-containing protein [Glutamicibacter uratoxydans]|uniref:helix-turn-helix domain-containing protein n=1 Tax=Glutamicibacter uratoxydans TaxID=43667 RepID=UPI003D6E3FC4
MADKQNFAGARFMTVAEVAEMMRVSKMTVYRLIHAGDLPAVQFGRSYRVPENAVEAYLQAAGVDPHRGTGSYGS